MYPVYSILISFLLGSICSTVARKRNRHPVGWFFLGAFFGVFGLVALYIMPSKAHTLQAVPAAAPTTEPVVTDIPLSLPESDESLTLWYYLDKDNNQFGPMSFDLVKEAWLDDKISNETYLWNESMEDWKPLNTLSEVQDQLTRKP